jgi:hypothetical protein
LPLLDDIEDRIVASFQTRGRCEVGPAHFLDLDEVVAVLGALDQLTARGLLDRTVELRCGHDHWMSSSKDWPKEEITWCPICGELPGGDREYVQARATYRLTSRWQRHLQPSRRQPAAASSEVDDTPG